MSNLNLLKKRKFLSLFIITGFMIMLSFMSISQCYNLVSVKKNSDINYLTIKNINSFSAVYNEIFEAFKPIKGTFTVYTFIKEFEGTSKQYFESENPDTLIKLHNIIIVKTNEKGEILDAFHYLMENCEVPGQPHLFRTFAIEKNIMDIKTLADLEFMLEYEVYSNCQEEFTRIENETNKLLFNQKSKIKHSKSTKKQKKNM